MKKNYLFLAATAVVMASCANEDFIGDTPTNLSESQAIGFNMSTPAMTRALDGKDAAGKLNNMFIVWGEKNETATFSETNTVFKNYVVKYTENSKNTTISNTNDWEYVGVDHSFFYQTGDNNTTTENVTSNIGKDVAQTIKYWDDKATKYTFTAVSALENDIKNGYVTINKTTSGDAYSKGYTVTVGASGHPENIFYADRTEVAPDGTTNKYTHEAVKLTFRNFQSKIRFGIYETVPGYKVVITGINYNSDAIKKTNAEKGFGVDGNFIVAGDNTKYTVTYENAQSANPNKVTVAVDANSADADYLATDGENWLSTHFTDANDKKFVSEDVTEATWDKGTNAKGTDSYTAILPNPDNDEDMTLKISYDLYSDDTNEKIETGFHTVVVPAEYCQWKSNYAYTYLFKITDKSADLYPITFDACVVEEQTGNQETITTVSQPSITTYATYVSSGKTLVRTGDNEYAASDVIYASIMEGATPAVVAKTTLESKAKLYAVEASTDKNYQGTAVMPTITEAAVANCIANSKSGVADLNGGILTITQVTQGVEYVDEVPAEDGTERTLAAMKWTAGAAGTTYAIQYEGTDGKMYYKIVKIQ